MEHEGKRGYVRLLNPLKVDSLPVTKVHLSNDAQLLTAGFYKFNAFYR
jgi:hypothetical protein